MSLKTTALFGSRQSTNAALSKDDCRPRQSSTATLCKDDCPTHKNHPPHAKIHPPHAKIHPANAKIHPPHEKLTPQTQKSFPNSKRPPRLIARAVPILLHLSCFSSCAAGYYAFPVALTGVGLLESNTSFTSKNSSNTFVLASPDFALHIWRPSQSMRPWRT